MHLPTHHRPGRRSRRLLGAVGALAAATSLAVSTPTPAQADELPPALAKFADCPVQDPAVTSCYYIEVAAASMDAGLFRGITAPSPMVLQFGTKPDFATKSSISVAPANGAPVLSAPAMKLPGGLLHMPWTDVFPLSAYITPTAVGLPKLALSNLTTTTNAPVLELDLRAKVTNPFTDVLSALGPGCSIGGTNDPIKLKLTTGTTTPPAPNQPITGNKGAFDYSQALAGLVKINGLEVVDNAWRLPGAQGCGPFGSLNWAVDLDAGHPVYDDAGNNSAVLETTVYQGSAAKIRAALAAGG